MSGYAGSITPKLNQFRLKQKIGERDSQINGKPLQGEKITAMRLLDRLANFGLASIDINDFSQEFVQNTKQNNTVTIR